jgi:hypothetical protein
MVGKAQKSHGAKSQLNSVFGLENWIGRTPLEHPPYSPDSHRTDELLLQQHAQSLSRFSTCLVHVCRPGIDGEKKKGIDIGGSVRQPVDNQKGAVWLPVLPAPAGVRE